MPIPVGVPSVDWSHPLAQGLVFCAGPYSAWTDLARGVRPSSVPACAHGASTYGRTSATDATNQVVYPSGATGHLDFTSQPYSILWVGATPATSGVYPLGPARSNYVSEASNNGWVFAIRSDADTKPGMAFQVHANNGVAVYAACSTGAGVITLNKQFVALGVSSGASTQTLYIDGIRRGTASSANPLSAGAVSMVIGQNASVQQTHVAIWNRAQSANEAAMLAADPFCFLRSPS